MAIAARLLTLALNSRSVDPVDRALCDHQAVRDRSGEWPLAVRRATLRVERESRMRGRRPAAGGRRQA